VRGGEHVGEEVDGGDRVAGARVLTAVAVMISLSGSMAMWALKPS